MELHLYQSAMNISEALVESLSKTHDENTINIIDNAIDDLKRFVLINRWIEFIDVFYPDGVENIEWTYSVDDSGVSIDKVKATFWDGNDFVEILPLEDVSYEMEDLWQDMDIYFLWGDRIHKFLYMNASKVWVLRGN